MVNEVVNSNRIAPVFAAIYASGRGDPRHAEPPDCPLSVAFTRTRKQERFVIVVHELAPKRSQSCRSCSVRRFAYFPVRCFQFEFAETRRHEQADVPDASSPFLLGCVGGDQSSEPQITARVGRFDRRAALRPTKLYRGCRHLRGGSPAELTQDTPTLVMSVISGSGPGCFVLSAQGVLEN